MHKMIRKMSQVTMLSLGQKGMKTTHPIEKRRTVQLNMKRMKRLYLKIKRSREDRLLHRKS